MLLSKVGVKGDIGMIVGKKKKDRRKNNRLWKKKCIFYNKFLTSTEGSHFYKQNK